MNIACLHVSVNIVMASIKNDLWLGYGVGAALHHAEPSRVRVVLTQDSE